MLESQKQYQLLGILCFYTNFVGYISVNLVNNKRKLTTQK